MPRTFAEALVPLPVTIRAQRHHLIYEVAPNSRDPKMTTLLEQALQRVTAANIKIGDRLLIARLRQPAEWTNTG